MAEAIRFSSSGPLRLEAPALQCAGLRFAERLALWALRRTVMGMRHRHDEGAVLAATLSKVDASAAVAAIEGFAMCLHWRANPAAAIRAPGDPEVSRHEREILLALACRQLGRRTSVVAILGALTPEDRLPAAIDYLDRWADCFDKSGLHLPPRCPTKEAINVPSLVH